MMAGALRSPAGGQRNIKSITVVNKWNTCRHNEDKVDFEGTIYQSQHKARAFRKLKGTDYAPFYKM